MIDTGKEIVKQRQGKTTIILLSSLIGILAGLVSSAYRFALTWAETWCYDFYDYLGENIIYAPLAFVALGLIGFFVGQLTKKYPLISGSGIPQVKGQMMGYLAVNWKSTIVGKFIGGTLAVLSGLSLGREGPSIQFGASVAQGVAEKFSRTDAESRIYTASGASAGLAAAFNAPMAGVMFALEEVFRYFSPMILLSTMVAAGVANFVSQLFFGAVPIFDFKVTEQIPIAYYWLFPVLGLILGTAGVAYNYFLLKSQAFYRSLRKIPVKYRMILPFLLAGVLGLTFPHVLCGGHHIINQLALSESFFLLLLIFLGKFAFSMFSFGSGAPGGIFFPLLVLGATIGALLAQIFIPLLGLSEGLFYNFVIIAMAAYFTAIVRAPLTGIILLVEMTGSFSQLLPLIVTTTVAFVVAEAMESKPIYDSLLENVLAKGGTSLPGKQEKKILLEMIVHIGAPIEGKYIRELSLHPNCLIVNVRRGEEDMTPHGDTQFLAGDYLTIVTSHKDETAVRKSFGNLLVP